MIGIAVANLVLGILVVSAIVGLLARGIVKDRAYSASLWHGARGAPRETLRRERRPRPQRRVPSLSA